jgi:hypothetical protein
MSDLEAAAPMPELDDAPMATLPEGDVETEQEELPIDTDSGEDTDPEDDGGNEGEPEPLELVTIERNGKQYQIPKELEGELLMQSDYTKKTQSVAERAKELDEREKSIAKQAEASEAELTARATLASVAAELAEYQKLTPADWQAHMNNDPLGTQQHRLRYEALRDQKAELEGVVSQAQTERTEKAQQDFAKRVQETLDAALTILPGVTAETRGDAVGKLATFATSEGIPEQVLKDNWSPTLLKLLHMAQVGKLAIAKQSAPTKATVKPVAPLQTVRSATSPTATRSLGDIAKSDDMEAYAAARAAGKRR